MCGDFSLVADPIMDASSRSKSHSPSLGSFIHTEDIHDVWCCQHANEHDFTYFPPQHNSYTCIDMFLVNKLLLQKVASSTISDTLWSDHAIICISLVEVDSCSPMYPWRCNNSIIQNPEFQKTIDDQLDKFFLHNSLPDTNPFTVWKAHKAFVRGLLIQIGSRAKKNSTPPN